MKAHRLLVLSVLALVFNSNGSFAGQTPKGPPITGRWDLTIHDPVGNYPSWLEISLSGNKTLVGRFVGHFGSVRPISQVFVKGSSIKFSLPVQWEDRKSDLSFQGAFQGEKLSGTTTTDKGASV